MGDEVKTKKAFVTREFKDSGTEQTFTASTTGKAETMPEIAEGAFVNYAHAGLVREATDDDLKAVNPPVTRNTPNAPGV